MCISNYYWFKFNNLNIEDQKSVELINWQLFSSDEISVKTSLFKDSYVIKTENKIVGMICLEKLDNENLYIFHFEVIEKRKKHGSKIIKELINALNDCSIKKIIVNHKDNISFMFWESLGFKLKDEDFIYYL